jgi:hypothetical protein
MSCCAWVRSDPMNASVPATIVTECAWARTEEPGPARSETHRRHRDDQQRRAARPRFTLLAVRGPRRQTPLMLCRGHCSEEGASTKARCSRVIDAAASRSRHPSRAISSMSCLSRPSTSPRPGKSFMKSATERTTAACARRRASPSVPVGRPLSFASTQSTAGSPLTT